VQRASKFVRFSNYRTRFNALIEGFLAQTGAGSGVAAAAKLSKEARARAAAGVQLKKACPTRWLTEAVAAVVLSGGFAGLAAEAIAAMFGTCGSSPGTARFRAKARKARKTYAALTAPSFVWGVELVAVLHEHVFEPMRAAIGLASVSREVVGLLR